MLCLSLARCSAISSLPFSTNSSSTSSSLIKLMVNQQQALHRVASKDPQTWKLWKTQLFSVQRLLCSLINSNSSTTSEARNTSLELSQICQSDASLFVSWSLLFFYFVSCELCNTIFSLWSLRVPLLSVFFDFAIKSFFVGYCFSLLVFEFCFGLSSYEWRKVKRANCQDFCFVNFEM